MKNVYLVPYSSSDRRYLTDSINGTPLAKNQQAELHEYFSYLSCFTHYKWLSVKWPIYLFIGLATLLLLVAIGFLIGSIRSQPLNDSSNGINPEYMIHTTSLLVPGVA